MIETLARSRRGMEEFSAGLVWRVELCMRAGSKQTSIFSATKTKSRMEELQEICARRARTAGSFPEELRVLGAVTLCGRG